MTYSKVVAQVNRLGQKADVLKRLPDSENKFGNPESEFAKTHEVIAVRTYPNRNTEVKSNAGDRNRDSPVFIIPKDEFDSEDDNQIPDSDARLRFPSDTGTVYELQAPTEYRSHIEIFGQRAIH